MLSSISRPKSIQRPSTSLACPDWQSKHLSEIKMKKNIIKMVLKNVVYSIRYLNLVRCQTDGHYLVAVRLHCFQQHSSRNVEEEQRATLRSDDHVTVAWREHARRRLAALHRANALRSRTVPDLDRIQTD